jgi:tetratricopeptide (TPR) repeat protein
LTGARGAALLAAALLLAGCAAQTAALRAAPPAALAAPVELTGTPFFPQTDHHCGPAALATVLAAAGLPADPQRLAEQVFLPARQGTLQVEMLAGARRAGAVATRLPATLEALLREVGAGHPVVVLLNLGLSFAPAWHYAVVVGYDLADGSVRLRSGTEPRAQMALRTFEHTWMRAGGWAFVALPPGRWPATATPAAVVEAAVAQERVAVPEVAAAVYRSAIERVGDDATLRIGLGNSLHAAGDLRGAAAAFRAAAEAHGSVPAWINLARTLQSLGDAAGARDAARRALAAGDPAWQSAAQALADALGLPR